MMMHGLADFKFIYPLVILGYGLKHYEILSFNLFSAVLQTYVRALTLTRNEAQPNSAEVKVV
jgi:hypothetical protein